MQITFLGTGTSSGVPLLSCTCNVCRSADIKDKRLRTSVLLSIPDTKNPQKPIHILIDAGPDFRQQMLRENIQHLDAVLITHGHKDHTGGIDDLRAYNFSSGKEIPMYANAIACKMIEKHYDYLFVKENRYPGIARIDLQEIKHEPFTVKGIVIHPVEVMHHKLPVVAFRIGDVSYITDAKTISETEIKKLYGTKTLIVNALRYKEHISHFNLEEAMQLVRLIQPEQTYFIHISHLFGFHEEIQQSLPQGVFIAYDGLKIKV